MGTKTIGHGRTIQQDSVDAEDANLRQSPAEWARQQRAEREALISPEESGMLQGRHYARSAEGNLRTKPTVPVHIVEGSAGPNQKGGYQSRRRASGSWWSDLG